MGVRERGFQRVELAYEGLCGELAGANQVEIRKAAASGQWGAAVRAMADQCGMRLGALADEIVQAHEWETQHDPWPSVDREGAWKKAARKWCNDFTDECAKRYDLDTHNIVFLLAPSVRNAFIELVDQSRNAVIAKAESRIGTRSEEMKSSNVKRVLGWITKAVTHAAAAVGGYLWHKYGF